MRFSHRRNLPAPLTPGLASIRSARQPSTLEGGAVMTWARRSLRREPVAPGQKHTVGRVGCALVVITAILVFPGAASADVLSLSEARTRVLRHAQATVDHPRTPFVFGFVTCSGTANHEKACTVTYDTATTRAEELSRQDAWVCTRPPGARYVNCQAQRPARIAPWACTERIVAYLNPYDRTFPHPLPRGVQGLPDLNIYLRYVGTRCSPLLYGTPRPLQRIAG
jgi:hypothetical protein